MGVFWLVGPPDIVCTHDVCLITSTGYVSSAGKTLF